MRTTLALALLAITAFASAPAQSAAPACGPAGVDFDVRDDPSHPAEQPERDKAFVYVIQDDGEGNCLEPLRGGCVTTRVGLDGMWAGATHHNSWIAFNVDPGVRHLCVTLQSRLKHAAQLVGLVHFNAEAGKTYYFRTRAFGREAGSQIFLDFDPIDSDQGKFMVGSFRYSVSSPRR
jgi:hypothetical protein